MAGTVVAVCTAELGAASLNRACTVREQRAVALSFGASGGVTAGRLSRCSVRKSSIIRNVAMQDLLPGMDGDGSVGEARDYPAGMQRYESMVVLRPDLTEDERVALTERYEEAMVAGGALDVEMFNRGMQPLAYNIKTKNMGGAMSRYLDGIYLLFTYVTKPASQVALQQRFNKDDDIIRSTTFRLKM